MLHYADRSTTTDILGHLSEAAAFEDAGRSIAGSMQTLMASGMLETGNARVLAGNLVAIAEVNLSAARLAEGHVNAIRLIRHFGGAPGPGLHGVWGADGDRPCHLEGGRIRGGKRFASGLGIVEKAVVTVKSNGKTLLAVVDVTDPDRHAPAAWDMLGMRATASGEIRLDDLDARWIGGPDDYFHEPLFLGGVWRIAALQMGGVFGLLNAAREALEAVGHLDADAQVARLAPLLGRAMAGFGLVERAAETAESLAGRADPERAVALSIQARLLTEDLAQDAIAAVERAVGLRHFETGAATGRIARDLATYCRQAARDAFEQRAARIVLGRPGRLSEFWHG
jgi:hypothetical protein